MAGALIGVFLLFSLAVTWVAGDREKAKLEQEVNDSKHTEMRRDNEIKAAGNQLEAISERLRETETKLKQEIAEKKKIERALTVEERLRRSLEEKLDN